MSLLLKDIETIQNNGKVSKYTNACFWISLKHNLRKLGIRTKVSQLRKIASYSGGKNEMLDFSEYKHKEEVDKVLDHFNIAVALFVVRNSNTISHVSLMGNTNNRIILPILYYEFTHFEAIINHPLRYGICGSNSLNQKHYFSLPIVTLSTCEKKSQE